MKASVVSAYGGPEVTKPQFLDDARMRTPLACDRRHLRKAAGVPRWWLRQVPVYSLSEMESLMDEVQIEQKSYEMPPREGFTVTHFITVADIDRSADFYEKVFGGRILSRGDSKGASGHIQIANTWLIVNVGGGPTPDKPSVTLSVPADPDRVSSFLNIRVADIEACYQLLEKSRSRVHHGAKGQVRRDSLLHPRS